MLWIDALSMIYCGIAGGIIGGFYTSIIHRKWHRKYTEKVEKLWAQDLKYLNGKLRYIENKISTKTVHKHVNNIDNTSNNNSYKELAPFVQGF